MKVAAIQMVSHTAVAHNIASAKRLLAQAAAAGAELALLPEYFCLMGQHDTDKLGIAEVFCPEPLAADSAQTQAPLQYFLADSARTHHMTIVAGTLPLQTTRASHVRNSCLVYDAHGAVLARYDKMHLFRFQSGLEIYDEGKVLERGQRPVALDYSDRSGTPWRIALSVCYDLRFPELFRALAADAIMLPAAFTHTTGLAHWEVLLRARAIENLAYVLASAQGGTHANGRRTFGHSMSVDPWGHVQALLPEGEGVVLADWDKTTLTQRRNDLPVLQHRLL